MATLCNWENIADYRMPAARRRVRQTRSGVTRRHRPPKTGRGVADKLVLFRDVRRANSVRRALVRTRRVAPLRVVRADPRTFLQGGDRIPGAARRFLLHLRVGVVRSMIIITQRQD